MNTTANNWHEINWQYLSAALATVRQALERRVAYVQGEEVGAGLKPARTGVGETSQSQIPNPKSQIPESALEQLCTAFRLSPFERDVLLLCVGMELDSTFAITCANAQGDMQRTYPTFSLAMAALPQPHWSALTPNGPLRHWQLVEVGAGPTLTLSPLRLDESVLHYLVGEPYLDRRLASILKPMRRVDGNTPLQPSHQVLAEQVAATWSEASNSSVLPIVQLCGVEMADKRAIATMACALAGYHLNVMSAHVLPPAPDDLNHLMQLWERAAALSNGALLLECEDVEVAKENAIAQLIEDISSPLIIATRERLHGQQRPLMTLDVPKLTSGEQRTIWQETLGTRASELNGQIDQLVANFNLSMPTIHAATATALSISKAEVEHSENEKSKIQNPKSKIQNLLWDICRVQARPHLDDLAQRIEAAATWQDLVLPEAQKQTLQEVAAQVRQRAKVYEQWGFASQGGRGLGISALFAGVSGTGKTMAAEVLAQELRLDLYRIDLSNVVSKYIGETEKNLRRVFDAAEGGGVILLFDEADALFGKRSEVKDSHDRYANLEVSYLLQRMESYQGLAILTTNLKDSLDTAFLRRIRFTVRFPFPDAQQRIEIWRRIFPKDIPLDIDSDRDVKKLARLNVSGGNIRSIALNAAFLAAEEEEGVGMKHLLRAAQSEYVKLERTLTEAEVKGWV